MLPEKTSTELSIGGGWKLPKKTKKIVKQWLGDMNILLIHHIKRTEPMQRRYGMRYLKAWEFRTICFKWGIPSALQLITRFGLKGEQKRYVIQKEEKALLEFNKRYCPVRDPNQIISREEMNDIVPNPSNFEALPDSKGQRVVEIAKTETERKIWRRKNPCNIS
jgi:hypothetical protein